MSLNLAEWEFLSTMTIRTDLTFSAAVAIWSTSASKRTDQDYVTEMWIVHQITLLIPFPSFIYASTLGNESHRHNDTPLLHVLGCRYDDTRRTT